MFTLRDTDLIILSKLNDKDLLSICLVNKAANKLCNYENFWRNRFINKYGEFASNKHNKPEERSWKKHYLQVVFDLERFSIEKFSSPKKFFHYILWADNLENSYYIKEPIDFILSNNWIPLSQAPEWVMTNLLLSNLGNEIIVKQDSFGGFIIDIKEKDLIPIKVFKKVAETFQQSKKRFVFGLFHSRKNNDLTLNIRFHYF